MSRIYSIDVVKGIVMILMALDHIRDLFHVTATTQDPLNLSTTTPLLFFTRWITHLCAPTFVFLSGTSALLSMRKKNSPEASRRFLITRGIWLVLLEFTFVNFGIWFDIHFNVLLFQVIGAIGIGFVLLGLCIKMQPRVIGIIGISIIALHNLIPLLPFEQLPFLQILPGMLFMPNQVMLGNTYLIMGYPPIPWTGIMFAGYGFGWWLIRTTWTRSRLFVVLGLFSLASFLLLRAINIYGDPAPWTQHDSAIYSIMSFLNVSKYPPSLLYCLLMSGIMFLLLALAERVNKRYTRRIALFGEVPLFYYLIHWYLIHSAMFVSLWIQGYGPKDYRFAFNFGRTEAEDGWPLGIVYLIWVAFIIILYPICKWYAGYKKRHPEKTWLRYL